MRQYCGIYLFKIINYKLFIHRSILDLLNIILNLKYKEYMIKLEQT